MNIRQDKNQIQPGKTEVVMQDNIDFRGGRYSPIQYGNSHVRHRYIQRRVIYKQNSFKITSRGVQRWTSTDFG